MWLLRKRMTVSNYQNFALYYDILTENIPYSKRGEYFHSIINKFGKKDGILVDLGCGTGSLSEVMARLGYDVIGIDNSYNMLNIAINKRYDSGLDIMYLCQEMSDIDLYGTMDICISALDSLNHIIDKNELKRTFSKVSLFLHPDGLFIFDVNTIYKHQNVLANNAFIYDCDDVYCAWQNTLSTQNIVEINLDLFCKNDDDTYSRQVEHFYERAYSHDEIVSFINEADLKLLDFYHADTFDKPTDTTERVVYVVKSTKTK